MTQALGRWPLLRTRVKSDVVHHSGVLTGLALVIVMGSLGSNAFLTSSNFAILAQQMAGIGIVAAGTTILMISGGIDLSIGSAVSADSVFIARWLNDGLPSTAVVVMAIALSAGFGLVIGLVITLTKAPPFMVTIGGLSILEGLATSQTANGDIAIKSGFTTLGDQRVEGIPVGFIVMIGILLLTYCFLHQLRMGRAAFAIGNNETAARLSGIRVDLTKVFIYVLNGCLVGLGACVITSAVGTGGSDVGTNLELEVIAAVVIGGASLAGGEGSVFGSLLGVLLIGMITNALNLMGVGTYLQSITSGGVIIVAVAMRSSTWWLDGWRTWRHNRQRRPGAKEIAVPPAQALGAESVPSGLTQTTPAAGGAATN